MITFIPLELYHDVIKLMTLFVVCVLCVIATKNRPAVIAGYRYWNRQVKSIGSIYFMVLFFLISLRPISYVFGDMSNYHKHFLTYKHGRSLREGDYVFDALMRFCADYLTAEAFFFICSSLYLIPLFLACSRLFKNYWPLCFLFVVSQYDFYGFAVNGIRNGIGASLFLLALTYKKPFSWGLIALAIGFHQSLLLPLAAYLLAQRYSRPLPYLCAWFVCLGISLVYTGFGTFVASFDVFSQKMNVYLNASDYMREQFSAIGFRWDFVMYSALPIAVGSYFLFVKKVADIFYMQIFCIYLTCNAFWLLVIRIPSSNRFAYLSWFMMGLVTAYPLIKFYVSQHQHVYYALLLFMFYLFTFVMT